MFRINLLSIFFVLILLNVSYAQNEFLLSQFDIKNSSKNPSLSIKSISNLPFKYGPQSIIITQSLSQTIEIGNSISCATLDSGWHTDNSYWRAFNLDSSGINGNFNVTNVSIGVELARSATGSQQITCYLYSSSVPFPIGFPGFLTLIGTSTVYIPDQIGTIINIPVSGKAPAGSELIVQIFTPDGRQLSNSFIIGSNNFGQTGPSYFDAMICDISSPTDLADLGYSRMQIVMNVTGNEMQSAARVQFVHNSADILADIVDVYVNDILTLNDFVFRSATPFLDLPAGETLNIGIAPGNSNSVLDTLINFPLVFQENEKYIVFANGLLTSGYLTNPEGKSTDINFFIKPMAREVGNSGGIDLFIFHGATDAPSFEVQARELANEVLVDSITYGDLTNYLTLPAQDITLDLFLADGVTLVNSFIAPLSSLTGKSAAVFASGFLNPSANQNGASIGLFAVLPNGSVIELKPGIIPVELSSFSANANGSDVILNWNTATETNNSGFNVERNNGSGFQSVGFVTGKGTTTEIQNYSFLDSNLPAGSYIYRLKQIDFDGAFEYSNKIQVDINVPNELALYQNYPNPFNPSTTISFSLPNNNFVSLKVFNLLGQEISTLVNEVKEAGIYNIEFDASSLPSGIYLYKLTAGDQVKNKKMILIK